MAIPIYGMADHQVALYEKKDTEVDDSGVILPIFISFFKFLHINAFLFARILGFSSCSGVH